MSNVANEKNGPFSKSTPQLNKIDGGMKKKEPKNVRNNRLESQKKLSYSSPEMPTIKVDVPTPYWRRNEKFHRIFKTVSSEEIVLNFFSCAYQGDILLQGYLYITDHYFGFYSNILGHITKILIPVKKVTDIKKVKTAKVIPNAIKITAENKKFTFTSLISRDTTIQLMVKVWRKIELGQGADTWPSRPPSEASSSCSNVSGDTADGPGVPLLMPITPATSCEDINNETKVTSPDPVNSGDEQSKLTNVYKTCIDILGMAFPIHKLLHRLRKTAIGLSSLPRTTLFLAVCTVILIFLYMSAAFLIYRLNTLHYKHGIYSPDLGAQNFQDIYRWNSHLHAESVGNLQDALAIQIKQLSEVRKSLETLKMVTTDTIDTFQETTEGSAT